MGPRELLSRPRRWHWPRGATDVWLSPQVTDDSADEATHHQKPSSRLPSKRARHFYPRRQPQHVGDAQATQNWLASRCYWSLSVFITVNGQDGGGCRAASLRYLAAPMARARFTVHTPLVMSFKVIMLSLKCRSATPVVCTGRRLFAPTLVTFVGLTFV